MIWVRRAPRPGSLRRDTILWFIGGMALLYIVVATIWTLLALTLSPAGATGLMLLLVAAGIVGAVARAMQLDRRDAAERAAASRNTTRNEDATDGHTAPRQES